MKVSFFAPYGVFLSMLLKRSAIVDMTQILCENKDYNIFSSSQKSSFNLPQLYEWWDAQLLYL